MKSVLRQRFIQWLKWLWGIYVVYKIFRVIFPRKVKSIKGAAVLVTGAGGGLGKCIAKEFAKRGASKLILWDINEQTLGEAALGLRQGTYPGLKVLKTQMVNLAEREDVYKASKVALDDVGGCIDVVVNNAGILTGQHFMDAPDKKHELTMAVNTMAPMYITKAFLPAMLQRNEGPAAAFVNISSIASFISAPQMANYSASKFALRGFSEGLERELAASGLDQKCKISCICPSVIDTNMVKGLNTPGVNNLTPEYVAKWVVAAYECELDIVILPHALRIFMVWAAIRQTLGNFGLPIQSRKEGLMKKFDITHADDVLMRMGA